jgi:ribosomal protein S18 acetylase RimI-like enzyme
VTAVPARDDGTGDAVIRPYRPDDLGAVYEVCLKTGNAGSDASALYEDPLLLGHVYVGPYVTLEPELAFVLEDEGGVCGYALGARDSKAFARRLIEAWWPPLRSRYPDPPGPAESWSPTQHLWHRLHHPESEPPAALDAYPSHLHIDLLPRAQGRGHGTRMMDRLLTALRGFASPGVHLGVHPDNARAIAFYGKLGFARLPGGPARETDTLVLVRRL